MLPCHHDARSIFDGRYLYRPSWVGRVWVISAAAAVKHEQAHRLLICRMTMGGQERTDRIRYDHEYSSIADIAVRSYLCEKCCSMAVILVHNI